MQKDRIINNYITRAIIEANLKDAKENRTLFSLVKFAHRIDLEDTYGFKDFISFMHMNTNFSPILYQENDSFLIFLKDTKILEAKTMMKELNRKVKNLFRFEIQSIGITLSDYSDTSKDILDRVDKYYVMSKFSDKKNIFYGTVDFDFYDTIKPDNAIKSIFEKSSKITLNNLYLGIPISEDVTINGYSNGILQVSINAAMLSFYKKEKFTFIRHDLIPDAIKADILKIDEYKRVIVLGNLTFLPSSPVERKSARIRPSKKIHAILSWKKKKIISGHITSISENSASLEVPKGDIEEKLDKNVINRELHIQFQFVNKNNFLSLIDIKAFIFKINGNNIILNLLPESDELDRIKHYIDIRQKELLSNLKTELSQKR